MKRFKQDFLYGVYLKINILRSSCIFVNLPMLSPLHMRLIGTNMIPKVLIEIAVY